MAGSEYQAEPPDPRRPPPKPRPRYDDYDDDDDVDDVGQAADDPVQTLVPYKNLRALLAYYCGVFSLIPIFGIVLSLIAFVLGFLGYRYGRVHPTAKGTGHAIAGIVLGLLGLAVNAAIFAWFWTEINRRGPPGGLPGAFGPGGN